MSRTRILLPCLSTGIQDITTILSSIKVCSITGDIDKGKELHQRLINAGNESNIYVANSLIHMYSKCKSMAEAKTLFDKMPYRTIVSWNSLMLGYVENGHGEIALELLTSMTVHPNARTFTIAIKACTVLELEDDYKLVKGLSIHSQAVKHGVDREVYVASSLVDMYCKCGSLSNAQKAFERSLSRDVVLWTTLITGYVDNGENNRGLEAFSCMLREGCKPNARTYLAVVMACSNLAGGEDGKHVDGKLLKNDILEKGMAFQRAAEESGFSSDCFLASALIDMCSKCGSLVDAERVFNKVTTLDIVVWNSMMMAYVDNGEETLALQTFLLMKSRNVPPNSRTFLAPLKACAGLAEREAGCQLDGKLVKLKALEKGMAFHSQGSAVHGQSVDSDVYLASTLVDLYVKCGSMVDARRVFDRMDSHDKVSWGCLLLGYVESCEASLALKLFFSIMQTPIAQNSGVLVAAVKACISLGQAEQGRKLDGTVYKLEALEKGMSIHARARESSLDVDIALGSSLVDMYSACGSLTDAQRTFDRLERHDVVAWTGLINCYVENGEGEAALQVFATMDCVPNAQTYVAALKACGCRAALEAGRGLHGDLCRAGLENDSVLRTCLVDLYGKSSNMLRAQHVFDSGDEQDIIAWTSLVAGYSHQGDTGNVFAAFYRMQEEGGFRPNAVTFVSVLAACSHAGLVEKGRRIFRLMEEEYGVACGVEHYLCMVDMLGRANRLEEAMGLVERMPCEANECIWMTILGACKKWSNVEVAEIVFEKLVELKADDAAAYSLMASIDCSAMNFEKIGLKRTDWLGIIPDMIFLQRNPASRSFF